jgi:hypothetical protein
MTRSSGSPDDVALLGDVWSCWLRAGRRMPAAVWERASGLGDWTVRELYAHVARGVTTLAGLVAEPLPGGEPELADAASYFGTLMRRDAAAQVASAAREFARTATGLVDHFDGPATTALADARDAGASVVPTVAGSMRLADYVPTRVVEATVHLLDLRAAVPEVDLPPRRAMSRTVDVLVDLMPAPDFIRLATGRPNASAPFPVLT